MKKSSIVCWSLQILVALVLLQTLYFKFTFHPSSVALFSAIGIEPWGRYLVGIIELIAAILLLIPKTSLIGAFSSSVIGFGAVLTHLFSIGINYGGDPSLFILAVVVLLGSLTVVFIKERKKKK